MKTTKQNIKDTKEVISLLAGLTSVAFEAKRDDDVINIADFPKCFALMPTITPAFDGITNVLAELKDLDKKELDELLDHVTEKFEAAIPEQAFDTLVDLLRIAESANNIYRRFTSGADVTVVKAKPVVRTTAVKTGK